MAFNRQPERRDASAYGRGVQQPMQLRNRSETIGEYEFYSIFKIVYNYKKL